MAREKLDDAEIARRLEALEGWGLADGKLDRTFRFADFVTAFAGLFDGQPTLQVYRSTTWHQW